MVQTEPFAGLIAREYSRNNPARNASPGATTDKDDARTDCAERETSSDAWDSRAQNSAIGTRTDMMIRGIIRAILSGHAGRKP